MKTITDGLIFFLVQSSPVCDYISKPWAFYRGLQQSYIDAVVIHSSHRLHGNIYVLYKCYIVLLQTTCSPTGGLNTGYKQPNIVLCSLSMVTVQSLQLSCSLPVVFHSHIVVKYHILNEQLIAQAANYLYLLVHL